jgi:3-deoxy-D-arabino-heptulosonate 7-phosphate (DAHP) synthase class II
MNKHLGFPACPFAAKWRKDGKLRIEVRSDKTKYEKHLTTLLKDWNKKHHDILIFCDPYFDQYDEVVKTRQDTYERLFKKEKTS